jgi:hypothetical protein
VNWTKVQRSIFEQNPIYECLALTNLKRLIRRYDFVVADGFPLIQSTVILEECSRSDAKDSLIPEGFNSLRKLDFHLDCSSSTSDIEDPSDEDWRHDKNADRDVILHMPLIAGYSLIDASCASFFGGMKAKRTCLAASTIDR